MLFQRFLSATTYKLDENLSMRLEKKHFFTFIPPGCKAGLPDGLFSNQKSQFG
jgi:hypothetical protein